MITRADRNQVTGAKVAGTRWRGAEPSPSSSLQELPPGLQFRYAGFLGHCIRRQRLFPKAVGELYSQASKGNRVILFRFMLILTIAIHLLLQSGCSRPHSDPTKARESVLSLTEAAQLAARLANDKCEQLYGRRPFVADQYSPVLHEGHYRWGGLDVGASGGFSALITFQANGSEPKVEVYFSSDILKPDFSPESPVQKEWYVPK